MRGLGIPTRLYYKILSFSFLHPPSQPWPFPPISTTSCLAFQNYNQHQQNLATELSLYLNNLIIVDYNVVQVQQQLVIPNDNAVQVQRQLANVQTNLLLMRQARFSPGFKFMYNMNARLDNSKLIRACHRHIMKTRILRLP